MKPNRCTLSLVLYVLPLVAFFHLSASSLHAQCGVERWSVKTGTDADVGLVNLNSTTSTTVQSMDALPQPSSLPSNNRIQPTETTQFVIKATLVEYKLESDSDYHLVLNDSAGNSMIAEIPMPSCVGAGSPFLTGITNARNEMDAKYTVTSSFQTANIPVQIKGVGFFDFLHGQTGVAPNGVEIHPVLDIVFNPGTGNPSFSVSSPSTASVAAGGSTTVNVTTAVSGGFNSAIALSASGLPSGVSASFNPSSIAAPGAGSSVMTITANTLAAPGTYSVTIIGTGGGLTETAALSLTITSTADFSFSTPGSAAVTQGASTAATVTTTASGGFNSAISLSASGTPSGVTANFNPSSIAAPGSGSSTLTFTASSSASTGSFPITLTATGGGITHTASLTLTVSQSGTPSFAIAAPGSVVVTQGSSAMANVTVTVSGGFNSAVALSASGQPSGVTASFQPSTLPAPGSGTAVLTFTAGASVTPGDNTITITGTGGGLTETATMVLTVQSSGGSTQLITDGDFEQATVSGLKAPGWTATTSVSGHKVIVKGGPYAHGGTNYAELGGAVNEMDRLTQKVTIPAGTTSAPLTFWVNIVTTETKATVYDHLYVEIHNLAGKLLAKPVSLSNVDAASDSNTNGVYFQPAAVDLSAYAGQTIKVVFHATNDYLDPTTFRVDDVSILAGTAAVRH